jgi:protein NrfD
MMSTTTLSGPDPDVGDGVAEPPHPSHPGLVRAAQILTAVCLALGLVGVVWRFTGGHAAADYGSYVPWGLWIAAYVALVAASAGSCALAAVLFTQRMRSHYRLAILAMVVALGTFAAGMLNVWLDLGQPFRAWKMMVDTSWGSVMGLMAWLYLVYGVILAVGLFAVRHGKVPAFMERFAWVVFLFAVVFAGAEGALFGVVGARPLWESGLTPVLFLVEAALFGVALVTAAAVAFGLVAVSMARRLASTMLVLLAVLLVLEWAEFSTGLRAAVPAKEEALRTILTGPYWWVFWVIHLGLGVVLPAVLLLTRRSSLAVIGIAGGLVWVMGIASKLNLVLPALAQEELEGLEEAFHGPGLTHDYFPTLMEWLVWLGTLGLVGAVVLVGQRVLPILRTAGPTGTDHPDRDHPGNDHPGSDHPERDDAQETMTP